MRAIIETAMAFLYERGACGLMRLLWIHMRQHYQRKRLVPILLFLLMYTYLQVQGLGMNAAYYGLPLTYNVWSLLFASQTYAAVVMLSFILFVSDAPFTDVRQVQLVLRVGKRRWWRSHWWYLALTSVMFTCIHYVMVLVCSLPHVRFLPTWGKLIVNLGNGRLPYQRGGIGVDFNAEMLRYFSPLVALGYTFAMCSFVFFFVGLLVFCGNLFRSNVGNGLAVGVVIFGLFTGFSSGRWIYHFSPLLWLDISQLRYQPLSGAPTLADVIGKMILLIGILWVWYRTILNKRRWSIC